MREYRQAIIAALRRERQQEKYGRQPLSMADSMTTVFVGLLSCYEKLLQVGRRGREGTGSNAVSQRIIRAAVMGMQKELSEEPLDPGITQSDIAEAARYVEARFAQRFQSLETPEKLGAAIADGSRRLKRAINAAVRRGYTSDDEASAALGALEALGQRVGDGTDLGRLAAYATDRAAIDQLMGVLNQYALRYRLGMVSVRTARRRERLERAASESVKLLRGEAEANEAKKRAFERSFEGQALAYATYCLEAGRADGDYATALHERAAGKHGTLQQWPLPKVLKQFEHLEEKGFLTSGERAQVEQEYQRPVVQARVPEPDEDSVIRALYLEDLGVPESESAAIAARLGNEDVGRVHKTLIGVAGPELARALVRENHGLVLLGEKELGRYAGALGSALKRTTEDPLKEPGKYASFEKVMATIQEQKKSCVLS